MASLTGFFKSTPAETEGSEKLLDLYWNRAELKKEFAALRDEKYKLQDRIKHHEGATARERQKVEHLENLLLDREWVHNVVVFYQMRRLALHCSTKLERFAEKIKQQREKRVHSKTLGAWNEERAKEASLIEQKIGEQRLQVQLQEDQLQAERHRLMTMNGFVKIFRGRRLAATIDELTANIEAGQDREREMLVALDRNDNLEPPDHEGLDIAAKRLVNFMILSFVQQLYLHFEEDNLAAMAKEASEKSVGAINYGSRRECDGLIDLLEKRWDSMENAADYANILQTRASLIAKHAIFRDSDDPVPSPGSVATVFEIDAKGTVTTSNASLLSDNYFGVARVLSR